MLFSIMILAPRGRFNIGFKRYMSIISYIKETKAEMDHVVWPTKKQAILFTVAVVVIAGVVAYLLGFFDYIFSIGLQKLLEQ
jgi:preprotein translocase SecE subunit